jgi:hypothetical protein
VLYASDALDFKMVAARGDDQFCLQLELIQKTKFANCLSYRSDAMDSKVVAVRGGGEFVYKWSSTKRNIHKRCVLHIKCPGLQDGRRLARCFEIAVFGQHLPDNKRRS